MPPRLAKHVRRIVRSLNSAFAGAERVSGGATAAADGITRIAPQGSADSTAARTSALRGPSGGGGARLSAALNRLATPARDPHPPGNSVTASQGIT